MLLKSAKFYSNAEQWGGDPPPGSHLKSSPKLFTHEVSFKRQMWKMPHVQPVSLQKHWQAWAAGECSSPYNLTAASQTNFTGTREKEQRQKRIKWPLFLSSMNISF